MLSTWQELKKRSQDVLHLVDTSSPRLAASLAVGVFIGCTPFYGFHTILAIAVSFIFRLNKAATITGAWLNLPWVTPFLYGVSLKVGEFVLTGGGSLEFLQGLTFHELSAMFEPYLSMDRIQEGFLTFSKLMLVAAKPLFVGTVVVGLLLAVTTYVAALCFIRKVRRLQARESRFPEP